MQSNDKPTKAFPVSWQELHRDSKALAWRLVDLGSWQGIVAIARGGLVPATIIARELEIHLIETICVSSYDHQTQGRVKILSAPDTDGESWLIIEDVVDTGATAKAVRERLPKAHFAAVYAKPAGRPMVDTFITEVSQDTWIYFPWDTEPQFVRPIVDLSGRR